VATLLLLAGGGEPAGRAWLRAVEHAKFRRQVVPGDRLQLQVTLGRRRGRIARAAAVATVAGEVVAECDLVMAVESARTTVDGAPIVHETAIVDPGARLGEGTVIGPFATIGPNVTIGRRCRVGASAVIDGTTEIGDDTEGEPTRLVIGRHNVFREFVTIHRGTAGGGGLTSIGDNNLFMAYAHVAHDCHVGSHTIFGNGATLGGHVTVEDYAAISAYSGVHQFCRVGKYAFVGGYTVVTRDALPYAKTVGNRARIYGLNSIGLARRGFSSELISKLRRAYRHLLQHNTSRALELIERDPTLRAPEVSYLVNFITSAKRGVILRRPSRRQLDEPVDVE
jgi:UDP-N-acetylglucosamine acyltransferase